MAFKQTKLIKKAIFNYTQLVPRKLVQACNARIQQSMCGLTMHPMPMQLLPENSYKCLNDTAKLVGDSIEAKNFQSQLTRTSPLAEQSFGMCNISTHHIAFELCVMEKKEDMDKIEFFMLVYLNLIKVIRTNRVDLAIEQQGKVVCKLFVLLCFLFLGAASVINVQVTILNLPHSYRRGAIVLLDNFVCEKVWLKKNAMCKSLCTIVCMLTQENMVALRSTHDEASVTYTSKLKEQGHGTKLTMGQPFINNSYTMPCVLCLMQEEVLVCNRKTSHAIMTNYSQQHK